jgi:hypothetical protein
VNAPAPIVNTDITHPGRTELGSSAEIGKLADSICAVMGKLKPIAKTQPTGKGLPYEFLSEDAITSTLRPLLAEAGLVIFPRTCEVVEREDYLAKSGGEMTRFLTRHTWRILHASGQWIDGQTWGEATDSGDKCLNKCMTAAFKYFQRQTFAINGGNDPDDSGTDQVARGARGHGGAPAGNRAAANNNNRGNYNQAATNNRPAGNAGNANTGNAGAAAGNGAAGPALKPATDADAAKATAALDRATDHEAVAKIISYARGFDWTPAQKQRIRSTAAARRVSFWTVAIQNAATLEALDAIQTDVGGSLNDFPELAKAVHVRAKNRADALTAAQNAEANAGTDTSGGDGFGSDMPYNDVPVDEMQF